MDVQYVLPYDGIVAHMMRNQNVCELFTSMASALVHAAHAIGQSAFDAAVRKRGKTIQLVLVLTLTCLLGRVLFLWRKAIYKSSVVPKRSADAVRTPPRSISRSMQDRLRFYRSQLRGHRHVGGDNLNELPFEELSDAIPGIRCKDVVLACGPEETRQFRRVIHSLFTSDRVRTLKLWAQENSARLADKWIDETQKEGWFVADVDCMSHLRRAFWVLLSGEDVSSCVEADDVMLWIQALDNTRYDLTDPLDRLIGELSEIEGSLVHKMQKEGLSKNAARAMIITLYEPLVENTYTMILRVFRECSRHPKLQGYAASGDIQIRNVFFETLRVRPPLTFIRRHDKNLVPIAELGQDAELVGSDPSEFRPQRFDAHRSNFWPSLPFLPFGSGTHVCPGWKATAVTATVLLKTMLSKGRILRVDDTRYPSNFALQPLGT